MLNTFNPDIKVTLVEGKYISKDSVNIDLIKKLDGIERISFSIEETSFFDYKGSQEVGIIKGVDENFVYVTGLDSSIVSGKANFDDEIDYALLGSGMNTKLSINPSVEYAIITAYMPTKEDQGPLGKDFNTLQFYPSGTFSVGSDIDIQYVLVNFQEHHFYR